MKNIHQIIWTVSSVIALSFTGCKALDAIDSANAIPGKMDALEAQVGATNGQIKKTNESIHLQTLYYALKDMRDINNWAMLTPPYFMLASAKALGEEIRTDELAELVKVLKKSMEISIDEFFGTNNECVEYSDNIEVLDNPSKYSPEQIKAAHEGYKKCTFAYNINKLATLQAVQAIMGLMPQAKIETLVQEQIVQGGAEYDQTLFGLASRYTFLRDVRYAREVYPALKTPGGITLGIKTIRSMDYLLSRDFAPKLNGIKIIFANSIYGKPNTNKFQDFETSVSAEDSLDAWTEISKKIEKLEGPFVGRKDSLKSEARAAMDQYGVVSSAAVLK